MGTLEGHVAQVLAEPLQDGLRQARPVHESVAEKSRHGSHRLTGFDALTLRTHICNGSAATGGPAFLELFAQRGYFATQCGKLCCYPIQTRFPD